MRNNTATISFVTAFRLAEVNVTSIDSLLVLALHKALKGRDREIRRRDLKPNLCVVIAKLGSKYN